MQLSSEFLLTFLYFSLACTIEKVTNLSSLVVTILTATKSDKVFSYNEFCSVKSHDSLITYSGDFDFSYMICRFRMQTSKSSPNSLSVCFPSSSPRIFQIIREFRAKKYFTYHWTANTIQLFVASKGNVSGIFFSEQAAAKWNSPETTW